ncbi:MAG TPA: hypothetical protein ENK37_04380 [Oceanithermus profundus]|uniref:YvlB/LiaX N-terminal domain-containing protein n=1 Tax=Oceanithermus profundus TaxID=187137 RepID=A0A7C4ZGD8_9DEIN|nr:hypothetical protein [Oceanithermus profundus]
MDEYMRIARLLEEGKIDPEEARRLLEALEGESAEPVRVASRGGLRARIERADLRVQVRAGLNEPVIEEDDGLNARLEAAGSDWKLTAGGTRRRFFGAFNLLDPRKKLRLALPPDLALDLQLGQGEVRIQGALLALRVQLGQGRLRFDRTDALDVRLGQGEVEGRARIVEDHHRVQLGMGKVRLTLEPGSDLRLKVNTGLGEAKASGRLQYEGKGPSVSYDGSVGEGRGELKVSVGMGDVEVRLP